MDLFNLSSEEYGVMVQAESWELAYFMIIHSFVPLHDRILFVGSKERG